MKYKVGIIGCGVIGNRLGRTFEEHHKTEIIAACDINPDVLNEYITRFDTKGYQDYKTMMEEEEIDIIYVGVPPEFHHEIVQDALNQHLHVICEKPIGVTAEEGWSMVDASNQSEIVTAVNLPLRYTPAIEQLAELLDKVGDIRKIILRFRFPRWPRSWQDVDWLKTAKQGGPLREVGTHFIFAVHELIGRIQKVSSILIRPDPDRNEQSITGIFRTENGISGMIDLECYTHEEEENSLTFVGTERSFVFTDWRVLHEIQDDGTWKLITDESGTTTMNLVTEFVKAIETGSGNLVSFEDATRVQSVLDAIFDSEMNTITTN